MALLHDTVPGDLVIERCRLRDVPPAGSWISAEESKIAGALRLEVRRRSWIHGRWTAKRAALRLLREEREAEPTEWSILAAGDGAPEAWRRGMPLPVSISLSHRSGAALAVAANHPAVVGCDVERIETRSEAFIDDFFVTSEKFFVREVPAGPMRDLRANLVWSGKEAVLKLLRSGLRLDTRTVVTTFKAGTDGSPNGEWQPFRVLDTRDQRVYRAWWRTEGQLVETVAVDPDRAG